MNIKPLLLLAISPLLFNACGEQESAPSYSVSIKIVADAGEDKRTKINEPIEIIGIGEASDKSVISYEWKEENKTLATTHNFTYIPTQLGVNTLDFIVQHPDGSSVSDTMKVIVTQKDIDTHIPPISKELITLYLKTVNNARSQTQECGTKGIFPATTALKWNEKLYKAAYEHMQDLIKSKTFAHEGSGTESDWAGYALNKKSDLIERAENYNYDWSRLGENLGGGTNLTQAQEMVQAWLESDYHCENLMNPNFTELGMVMIKSEGSLYTHYWAQEFGTPK